MLCQHNTTAFPEACCQCFEFVLVGEREITGEVLSGMMGHVSLASILNKMLQVVTFL